MLSQQIKERLQEDQRRRAAKAGSAVDSLLASDPPLIGEAWIWMQGWYKYALAPPPPSTLEIVNIDHVVAERAERAELYQHVHRQASQYPW